MIRQLSIFVQNEEGRLSNLLKVLKDEDINIRTLTIVDTYDYGIVRLILEDVDKAIEKLKEKGIMVNETKVFAAEIPDTPGGMYQFINSISKAGINVEYVYSYSQKNTKNAVIVFKINEIHQDAICEVLKDSDIIELLTHEQLMKV